MIPLKTPREIELMKQGGRTLSSVMDQVLAKVAPGVVLSDLDKLAEALLVKAGGEPAFKRVPHYDWMTCLNVNEGVVHGVPNNYCLKKGDLLSLDMGNFYKGFHTDMARSVWVGKEKRPGFLGPGQKALKEAISLAKAGNHVGHLSQAIEKTLKKPGFFPVRDLTGHGVGRELHEDPAIPGFLGKEIKETPVLKVGMCLAIEVIYTPRPVKLSLGEDGWTTETKDGSLAALFENTVAITKSGPLVLTG